jgi:PAS domain S-box-containing protein
MSNVSTSQQLKDLTAAVRPEAFRAAAGVALRRGAGFILAIAVIAIVSAALVIRNEENQFLADQERRVKLLASGRADVAQAWLESQAALASRVVDSDTFRLFAAETAEPEQGEPSAEGLPEATPLLARSAYLSKILSEFVQLNDLISAHLIDKSGTAYVTSALAQPLTPAQQTRAALILKDATSAYGPVRDSAGGLVLDYMAPVFPPQTEPAAGAAVGVFLFGIPLTAAATDWLEAPALAREGESLRLVQKTADGFAEIIPGQTPSLYALEQELPLDAEGNIPFAVRAPLAGAGTVYSAGAKIQGADLWLLLEAEQKPARAGVRGFVAVVAAMTGIGVVAALVAFGAFWWRMASGHNRALAEQFQSLAGRIETQRQLLDSINNTIADHIGLKGSDGAYVYVNPAFAGAVGRPIEQLVGQTDEAIYGHGTAQTLKVTDQQALLSGRPVTVQQKLYLQSRLHHLQIAKVPFKDAKGAIAGIVSVARDVTQIVEERERRERAVQQMVDTLARAIELRDPYLAGHTRRVAAFASAVAYRVGCDADEIDTLTIAARLSQVGKLSIDQKLLTKPERHSALEIVEMQQHIKHAAFILKDVDFGLPVLETVYQMYERLDGGGYPLGLKADAIRRTARILGVCDVFCARIAPRSYRAAIRPEEALGALQTNTQRYDAEVVAALADVVRSVEGEKLMAGDAA